MSKKISLVFPHQLFKNNPILKKGEVVYLIEEFLFFKQYKFHKQKIGFHRATMKFYQDFLEKKGHQVFYIEAADKLADIRNFGELLKKEKIETVKIIDPVDEWLMKRIKAMANKVELQVLDSPLFLNNAEDLSSFFREDKKSFFQTTFYKQQRKKRNILLEDGDKPLGGKWTYDSENRKKYPKGKQPPNVYFPENNEFWTEAVKYTEKNFKKCPGEISPDPFYPTTHKAAEEWFSQFLEYRFFDFGIYEDAIVSEQTILNHSLLSPLINVGLLLPEQVVTDSLEFAEREAIPLNSTEGFVRQIIGWREFIRGMYECKGTYSRNMNFWKFKRKIPASFYDGTTGIPPIDTTIKRILKTGYCHHIERLMILGNFMFLCEFHPDEVYRWFMEMFIDAYDWVMVPNVYGMSQFADGGTFATKPYISGSNYVKKMSNYGKGDWQEIWDGLFWRFIEKEQDFFKSNPRTSMLLHSYNRKTDEQKKSHRKVAEKFLKSL